MTKPPVLILAFANYYERSSGYLRNIPEERKQLIAALKHAEAERLCELEILYEAKIEEVAHAFRKHRGRAALFHFAGHADGYTLHLESPFRKKDPLFMEGFAEFLAAQPGLQLVFLNGCSTEAQSQMLIRQGLPAVITTDAAVSDELARSFASQFYQALGAGQPIGQAFREAGALIKSLQHFQDPRALYRPGTKAQSKALPWKIEYHPQQKKEVTGWNLPDASGQPLFTLPPLPEALLPSQPYPGLRPYSENEHPIFWGRDQDIRRLYDTCTAEEAPRAIIIYGTPGVGKTSFLQAGLVPYLRRKHQIIKWLWPEVEEPTLLSGEELLPYFLILDNPPPEAIGKIGDKLKMFFARHSNLRAIICLPTDSLPDWQQKLEQEGISKEAHFLHPLAIEGIQMVIEGGRKKRLTINYGASISPDLPGRLAHLFSKDEGSCLAPLLQYGLVKLWETAQLESLEQPLLSWQLFQELMQGGLWEIFIEQQLQPMEVQVQESGLLLNLLKEHLPEDGSSKIVAVKDIEDSYEAKVSLLINQLMEARLLCPPAAAAIRFRGMLRLSHQLLERPLLRLLYSSQQPGQALPRFLQQHIKRGSLLSRGELKLLETYRSSIPRLSTKEKQLEQASKEHWATERRKRRFRRIASAVAILMILLFGYLFVNPYLLLYGLLVYIAYQGSGYFARKGTE